MKRLFVLAVFAVAAMVPGCSGGGDTDPATPAPYESEFDGAGSTDSWLFYNPNDPNTPPSSTVTTLWGFDATAADMPGGAFVSAGTSLNYNNGADYNVGSSAGVAISPKIDIGGMTAPILVFKCNYETEDTGTSYDQRHVKIGYLDSNMNPVYYVEEQLSTTPGAAGAGACQAMGQWHEHVIALDPSWGQIRVAYGFDSIDGAANTYHGWFVDDFSIIEASAYTPWTGTGGTGGGTGGGGTGGVVTGTYTTDFEAGAGGWVLGGAGVAWAADGDPATMPGGAANSGASSLNYNDGIDYDNGAANSGTATSPSVDITAVTGPFLKFACNYQTETAGTTYDQRWIRVRSAQTGTLLYEGQLAESGGAPEFGPCQASGTWHEHTLALDPSWGPVKVEFTFDSIDDFSNAYAGWFIDDVTIGNPASSGGGGGTGIGTGTGTGTGGGSGPPVIVNGPNGDNPNGKGGINDAVCAGSAAGGAGRLALLLIVAMFVAVRRRA